ncbi:DUF6197 family protein [Streptomyces sp. NBC_00316]|uniref:DUF6197 family protein n=1 Tax=Streptomyces sp. NBC_00316 TaxID=2975710 RepID=UPI003FA7EA51
MRRAHHRLLTDGWCTGAKVDEEGARCLYGVIRAEACSSSTCSTPATSGSTRAWSSLGRFRGRPELRTAQRPVGPRADDGCPVRLELERGEVRGHQGPA